MFLDEALQRELPGFVIFRRMPRRVLAPFLEVGIGALGQILSPCRFKRRACGLEVSRGAVSIVAGIAAWVKSAAPLPLIQRRRGARSLDDHPDSNASIMHMPGHGRSLTRLRVSAGILH
jgi:hypothetical protein